MGNKVTIPAEELLRLFKAQYDKVSNVLYCCEIMEQEGIAKKTGAVDVISEIAKDMQTELTCLIYQFDSPETKGEAHIMPKE